MSSPTDWAKLVQDSIEVVMRRLSSLPDGPEVEALGLKAAYYIQQARGWERKLPTVEQRETLMKRVLALHVEVAKIERREQGGA